MVFRLFLILSLLVAGAESSVFFAVADDNNDDSHCPKNLYQWDNWKNLTIESILPPENMDPDPKLAEFIQRCTSLNDSKDQGKISSCMKPIVDWARARPEYSPDFSRGFTISDKQYGNWNNPDYPKMMAMPEAMKSEKLLRDLSQLSTQNDAISELEKIPGAIVLPYTSQHFKTPDDAGTMGRILVYIPGDAYDQWFQFGARADLKDGKAGKTPTILSLVAVQKQTRGGVNLDDRKRVYFTDFQRKYDSSGNPTGYDRIGVSMGTCWQCHAGGVNHILPADGALNEKQARNLYTVNAAIRSYGTPDWKNSFVDVDKFGPGVGPEGDQWTKRRSDAFLRSCVGNVKPDRYGAIRNAMNCAHCHHLGDQPVLTGVDLTTNDSTKASKAFNLTTNVPTFIRSGRMPKSTDPSDPTKHIDLSPDEREALISCLKREYDGWSTPFYDAPPGVLDLFFAEKKAAFKTRLTQPHCLEVGGAQTPQKNSSAPAR